ncbi:MAG: PorT family protein, partial [Flavobacteriaceae bacterium]|nr:PorT family protein [Flavobacteriaceae bacterium]
TLSFGNGKINFFGYYGLNPFFKEANTTSGVAVDVQDLKLGLMFYIL